MPGSGLTLERYNAAPERPARLSEVTLHDETFVADWERYRRIAETEGVKRSLAYPFPALFFPLGEDVQESEAYQRMRAEGIADPERPFPPDSLLATHFDTLSWELYQTSAGKIPVIYCRARTDFEAMLRAITAKNSLEPIPVTQGAQYISGYRNRERIRHRKRKFLEENDELFWPAEWKAMSENKDLYCDKLIILSNNPYSNIPARKMGLEDAEWLEKALILRREHECMHYIVRRRLLNVTNNVLDEIVADAAGMMEALNDFRASWLLLFLGFDGTGELQADGRLHIYRSALSDEDFRALWGMTRRAAVKLEKLIRAKGCLSMDQRDRTEFLLDVLCSGLEALCGE